MAPFSLAGRQPSNLGVSGGKLADPPSTPNCVSSDAPSPPHHVAPLAHDGARQAPPRSVAGACWSH